MILSVDVENWFDGNLHRQLTYQPGRRDRRLADEVALLLGLLAQHSSRATFFMLGTAADANPGVVRRIAAAGHEIACHSWTHDLLREQGEERYREGLRRCRSLLQDLTGQEVAGHRAPTWSLDRRVPWAVNVLLEAGFSYDSSVFPMRTPLYGEPGFPTTPYWLAGPGGERILEFPPAVRRFGPLAVPCAGGLYWRVLPLWLIRTLLRGQAPPAVTYLHPWELNAEPPALPRGFPPGARLALRWGAARLPGRLAKLLQTFRCEAFADILPTYLTNSALPTATLAGE